MPFSREYFAEYANGRVYERSSDEGGPLFYQRFYDLDRLERDVIRPSGLEVRSLGFIEERFLWKDPRRRLAEYVNGTEKQTIRFGIFYPLLARVFLSPPKLLEQCAKPGAGQTRRDVGRQRPSARLDHPGIWSASRSGSPTDY